MGLTPQRCPAADPTKPGDDLHRIDETGQSSPPPRRTVRRPGRAERVVGGSTAMIDLAARETHMPSTASSWG
ncbi:hypothetical protein SAMN02949497_3642 [Methylomagnum ishizawai]|uniref:Uncharacterized protein n=1 Tax=Methylomagnum ishizawai TaxID=1760988 RepID=A0A1Y6D1F6_9GAMM|nr:hypothetical protein [Methylomagnum ishizawai]SMF96250.1 hypothetical protein SAMN02949497_3642 [Methylomagnum ishizawai]